MHEVLHECMKLLEDTLKTSGEDVCLREENTCKKILHLNHNE